MIAKFIIGCVATLVTFKAIDLGIQNYQINNDIKQAKDSLAKTQFYRADAIALCCDKPKQSTSKGNTKGDTKY